jgi:hypothetical protein
MDIVLPRRLLPFLVLAQALVACELVTGLGALHETVGVEATTGGDAAGGSDTSSSPSVDAESDVVEVDDGGLDEGAIADVRALSDVVVPPGHYLLHVSTYRAHVTSDISAIACGTLQPDGGPPICDAVLVSGTALVLTATGSGSFDGWGGACTASLTTQCNITMTSDQSVFASFSLNH